MNAQEILKRKLPLSEFGHPIWNESNVVAAMEEYAQQSQSNPSKLVEALKKIAKWELPKTNRSWDDEKTQPLSYEAAYGSNGARDYIRGIAQQALESYKDGWVSVEERLPEYMVSVIIHTNLGVITESQYTGEGNKFQTDDYIFTATHWQPLPQKPVI